MNIGDRFIRDGEQFEVRMSSTEEHACFGCAGDVDENLCDRLPPCRVGVARSVDIIFVSLGNAPENALARLLACPALNLDGLEGEDVAAIGQARAALKDFRKSKEG